MPVKIIIVGAGSVGYTLAKSIIFDGYTVLLIDQDLNILANVKNKLDIETIVGNAIDVNVLKSAGIESADVIIAATGCDEVNIIICQVAETISKTINKIAIINNAIYYKNNFLINEQKFAINLAISANMEIVNMIEHTISVPGILSSYKCLNNSMRIITVINDKNSPFTNIPIKFVSHIANNYQITVLTIERDKESFIPKKNDIIMENDILQLAVKEQDLENALKSFKYPVCNEKNIIFIGGGEVVEKIAEQMLFSTDNVHIKILENSPEQAAKLSKNLPHIEVFTGNISNPDLCEEMDIKNANTVIAMCDNDLTNIFACLMAKEYGASCVAALVQNEQNVRSIYKLGINAVFDVKKAIINKILQYLRNKNILHICSSDDNTTEIFTINVLEHSRAIGMNINDIGNDVIPAAILRNNEVQIMPHNCVIKPDDALLISAKQSISKRLIQLFEEKPVYLS